MSKKFKSLLVIYYTKDDIKADCLVEVNNEKTSITAFNEKRGFENFIHTADFRNLFIHMLQVLVTFEKNGGYKDVCIKAEINTVKTKDKNPMNDYQVIRAILCSIWGLTLIYPATKLEKITLIVDAMHQSAVEELLRDENYKDFVDSFSNHPTMVEYIERYYGAKKR